MKKIYLVAAGLILSGSIIAQSAFMVPYNHFEKAKLPPNAKPPISSPNNASRVGGPFRYWVEPVGDVMTQKGIDLTGSTSAPSQDIYVSPVFQDSTVIQSFSNSTGTVSNILLASVLDPKSSFLRADFDPIVAKADTYSIDSLMILGLYKKVRLAVTDTLYTWLVWGDTTTTTVFTKKATSYIWQAPISTWRSSIIGAKIAGYVGAKGNKVRAAAPASNMMLVKYVLTDADTSLPGYFSSISIALPSIVNVPAGNIVSAFYTFVPGDTMSTGDCIFSSSTAPVPQNKNGFAGAVWQQSFPVLTALADYQDQEVDPDGWNMGGSYYAEQRHLAYPASYCSFIWGDLASAPLIYYSIFGNSTVGVNELNNNFSLGQNEPNPFTNQTKVNYNLKTSAKNVSFEIYNIAGVKLFDKTQSNVSAGSYFVEVNNQDFASGIYFYSLTVDGNKVTKKMVVTK